MSFHTIDLKTTTPWIILINSFISLPEEIGLWGICQYHASKAFIAREKNTNITFIWSKEDTKGGGYSFQVSSSDIPI